MIPIQILNNLNVADQELRLENLAKQLQLDPQVIAIPEYINNHIHTFYSFSPYSPTAAVYSSKHSGLSTAGIIDHDSIAGAQEFLKAGEIAELPVTCGVECRASMKDTPFAQIRLNNPDQIGVAYITIHAVPKRYFSDVDAFFKPLRALRNERNFEMVQRLNKLLVPYDIHLDFEKDVYPLSMAKDNGSITERHLLYALSLKLMQTFAKGEAMIHFFEQNKISLSEAQKLQLLDVNYNFYAYDILNILKANFIEQIYIPAEKECPKLKPLLSFAHDISAVLAYPYLGDVTASVTGDKKQQIFEDGFLDDLFNYFDEIGIPAISYMPTRNTKTQLTRLKQLCERHNKFQISGEDINSPRQDFICHAMDNPDFHNLIASTWALIAHENLANLNKESALFSSQMIQKYPNIDDRINFFLQEAKKLYPNKFN